jgi:hypothetical protein
MAYFKTAEASYGDKFSIIKTSPKMSMDQYFGLVRNRFDDFTNMEKAGMTLLTRGEQSTMVFPTSLFESQEEFSEYCQALSKVIDVSIEIVE